MTTFATAFLVLAGTIAANATQTVRETWEGIAPPSNLPIYQAYGDAYTVGFVTNMAWIANSNTPIMSVDNNSTVYTPGLAPYFVSAGDIWSDVYSGPGALIDYEDPRSWAVRQLIPASQINFNANGTYYFCIELQHGDDGALGIGFASGTNDAAAFVGAGITRASYSSGRFPTDLGNTLYISTGTLGQPGDPTDPYSSYPVEGPEMVMAYATNSIGEIVPNTGFESGLLIGQLTTSVGGSSTLSVWWATNGVTIPTDPSTVVWDATYSFNQTANMDYLLLWQTASDYANAIDAFRVADSWGEVVGIESYINISPGSTVPQGQAVTFSSKAHNTPVTYQWLENGVPILNATSASVFDCFPGAWQFRQLHPRREQFIRVVHKQPGDTTYGDRGHSAPNHAAAGFCEPVPGRAQDLQCEHLWFSTIHLSMDSQRQPGARARRHQCKLGD